MRRPPRIRGGLRLARSKPGLDAPILELPLARRLVFPLLGYGARALDADVRIGDRVAAGGRLAEGLYASAAGTVVAIERLPVLHPSCARAPCVVLETEGRDDAGRSTPPSPARPASLPATTPTADGAPTAGEAPAVEATPAGALIEAVRRVGIGGMGGAGYPTADKLAAAARRPGGIDLLLVNAAECEPGIACDEALIRADAAGVLEGVLALARALAPRETVIAIEVDKREATDALETALEVAAPIRLLRIEPVYPSGAERPLLELVTGRRLADGHRAVDAGLLCLNVATVHAIGRAARGALVHSRVVTIGGASAVRPCHVRVAFGTPVGEVLEGSGNGGPSGDGPSCRLRIGGPLSGFDIDSRRAPVTATTNRIALEPPLAPSPAARPCIRCGDCATVCPVGLLPQQLHWQARGDDLRALERQGLSRCIECGCCDLVCPSSIELTASFRHARGLVREAAARADEVRRADAAHLACRDRLARGPMRRAAAPAISAAISAAVSAATPDRAAPEGEDERTARGETSRATGGEPNVAAAIERARARALARAKKG